MISKKKNCPLYRACLTGSDSEEIFTPASLKSLSPQRMQDNGDEDASACGSIFIAIVTHPAFADFAP